MGDPAGQLADGLQLLRKEELLLEPLALADIDAHADHAPLAIERNARAGQVIGSRSTTFGDELGFQAGPAPRQNLDEHLLDRPPVSRGEEVDQAQLGQLLRRVARDLFQVVVPAQKLCFGPEQAENARQAFDQRIRESLLASQALLGPLALAHILDHHLPAELGAQPDRRQAEQRVVVPPIFASEPRLVLSQRAKTLCRRHRPPDFVRIVEQLGHAVQPRDVLRPVAARLEQRLVERQQVTLIIGHAEADRSPLEQRAVFLLAVPQRLLDPLAEGDVADDPLVAQDFSVIVDPRAGAE